MRKMIMAGALGLAAFVSAGTAVANEIKDWQRSVVKAIVSNQNYPDSAISRGIEGQARVRIAIDETGAIQSFEVTQPTGAKVLDREIPKLIKRVDPLPAPPSSMDTTKLTFVLPLVWRLQ